MATLVKGGKTVRYRDPVSGKQREQSFGTRPEARQFKAQVELDISKGTFVDPKLGTQKFRDAARGWLDRHPGTPKTKEVYESVLRLYVLPEFGHRALKDVAGDREGVELWVRKTLPDKNLGASSIRTCYLVLSSIINDAIKGGRLHGSRIKGIKMPEVSQRAEFEFAYPWQIEEFAARMEEPYGFAIYLMYGCGLRVGEALGVCAADFREKSTVLRVSRQRPPRGGEMIPLKHRGKDGYRDVPVPEYVKQAMPTGFMGFPPISHRAFLTRFHAARNFAHGPVCTPHTLRHMFASQCLASGVPITDVSKWLGHKDINMTYAIYGHLVPGSWDRAREALDAAWQEEETE